MCMTEEKQDREFRSFIYVLVWQVTRARQWPQDNIVVHGSTLTYSFTLAEAAPSRDVNSWGWAFTVAPGQPRSDDMVMP